MGSWKGSTEIILTDTKTKKVKKVKSENVFKADNIAKFCNPFGGKYGNMVEYLNESRNDDNWKTLVGGLLLFDKEVPTNSYMAPSGIKMTGNGSYDVANPTNVDEMGSWNGSESSKVGDTLTLVWDFTTAQAIGAISSVCLTSDLGGYIGYGNQSGKANANIDNKGSRFIHKYNGTSVRVIPYRYYSSSYTDSNTCCVDDEGYAYTIIKTPYHISNFDGNIPFKKQRLLIDSIDLLSNPYVTRVNSSDTPDINIDIGTGYRFGSYPNLIPYDDKFYIITNTLNKDNVSPNEKFILMIINPSSETVIKKEYTNILDIDINTVFNANNNYTIMLYDGIFLVFDKNNKKYYIMDCINNEISEVDWDYPGNKQYTGMFYKVEDYFIGGDAGYIGSILNILDPVNKTMKPINCFNYYGGSADSANGINGQNYNSYYKAFMPHWIAANPFYLATINNLSEPVYKTDSQTMKVIYTLTRQQS